jgi:flagellar protein FlaG
MPAAVTPIDPVQAVQPAGSSANNGATDDSTSQQQKSAAQPADSALEDINSQMKAWQTQLQFSIDPDLDEVVVSLVDSESGDVIRTIPSDVVLRIAKMIVKMQGNSVETEA